MRAFLICGISALLTMLSVHPSHAQQYYFARYTPRNGLVNNRVRAMYQDSRGRLYFATYGGLSVYDGARFINYTTGDGLATGLVNDVIEMGDDSVWVLSNTSAIHCLVHGILKNIVTADHFCPIINQLIRCSDGYFYAISDDGLFRLQDNRFIPIPLKDRHGKEVGKYLNQAIESHHRLIIVNDPNLDNVIHAASLLEYDLVSGKCTISDTTESIYTMIETPTHDILVGTSRGVRRLDTFALRQDSIHLLPPPDLYTTAAKMISWYMYFDRSGSLWLSAPEAVVRIGKGGDRQAFTPYNGLPAGAINFILQDRENNMWFGNEQNGVVKLVDGQVQFYSPIRPGFKVTDLSARENSDSVWMYDGTDGDLLLVHGDKQTIFHSGIPIGVNNFIAIGKKAYLVSSNDIFTLRFEGHRYYATPVWHDSIRLEARISIDKCGNLVLPSRNLSVFTGTAMLRQTIPVLADQAAIDDHNRIWAITRSNELFLYRIDSAGHRRSLRLLHRYGKNELPAWSPRSVAVDHDGRVWIGTRDHGVYWLEPSGDSLLFRQQLTTQDGLSENFISYLHCDPDNSIWACTPTGLDRIRIRNGQTMIDNITLSSDRYDAVFKIFTSAGNIHWVMARGGVMKIAPFAEESNGFAPKILFSRVQVGDEPVPVTPGVAGDAGGALSLPYYRNTLNFFVGAPTFINEGLTRYSFLLEGSHDPKWSAPSARPDIGLVNLPPGKYTLHVKAQFLTGRYADETAVYPFIIRPPWWQTWWFRVCFAGCCVAIVIGLTRLYIGNRLEIQRTRLEKKRAVEKERTRIATDMHDDLGAGLSRIKFLSETMHLRRQMGQSVHEDLGSISRYANEMIGKMGEIVWALNEKNDSL
ncbi:MAG TPA: two-component regulator propeller domain-containing protein, partial [Puia sp.]|nr:two-component regulator propeller domain-containing protein [Puia sp.]